MTPRGRGRPKLAEDSADNREAILIAARELFSDNGFERTTMRSIGQRAGVDPALIHHYFGTKNDLLVAALRPEVDVQTVFAGITSHTTDPGEEFLRRVLGFWESNPQQRARAIALLRIAVTREEIAGRVRDFFLGIARMALGEIARPDDRDGRIALVVTQTIGLAMSRYILKVPDVENASIEELATSVGPSIDRYLLGDLGA